AIKGFSAGKDLLLNSFSYLAQNTPSGQGQCSTSFRVTFTTTASTGDVVIAWGGHIASQGDWGIGNSASAINGSPYHMALNLLDGASTGSQDRALATSAIFFTPSIATTLSATSVNVGGSVTDSATLTGASSNAGGTVTYTVYTDSGCTSSFAGAGTKTVTNAVVPNSDPVTFNTVGTFFWQAVYSGDGANLPATSACTSEQLVVAKNSPSIATTLSATTANIGDTVHDSATLTGATGNAGGTVTYTVYTDNVLKNSFATAGTTTVPNAVSPDSTGVQFNQAGTFFWQAVYSGDANNNGATSACQSETLTVGKNSPSIATTLSATTANIGDTVHDSATLTGRSEDGRGAKNYTVHTDTACKNSSADAGTKRVTNAVVLDSNGVQFNQAETFFWQAVYSGDANNNGATSACQSETLTVGKNSPSIATTLSATTANIGDTVHDSATLTG